MEPIEVTARFDAQGTITPLAFTRKGSQQRVKSTGRRWVDEQGQHFLVMTMGEHMYELIFRSSEGLWYISRAASNRTFA